MRRTEHRRVDLLQDLPAAEVHVHAAGQARVNTAERLHDVHDLEIVRPALFEDRRSRDGSDYFSSLLRPYSSLVTGWPAAFQPFIPSAITATLVCPASAARPAAVCDEPQVLLVQ